MMMSREPRVESRESDFAEINVLVLVKNQQRYVFLFDDDRRSEVLKTLGRFAANPDLDFSWYDAAVLSQKLRASDPSTFNPQLPTQ